MASICIFCGARPGQDPTYEAVAKMLGKLLAEQGITLVYGGGNIGLMGIIADAALAADGQVIGVIPEFLKHREMAHQGLTKQFVVHSMHERKAKMAALSDGFIAMPGGFGTLEELFEIVTWAQLNLHQKPLGLLNVRDFYTPLLNFMEHQETEGFVSPMHRAMVLHDSDPQKLLIQIVKHIHANQDGASETDLLEST